MADLSLNSEESISKILESAYEQASAPSEFRARLLQELQHDVNIQGVPRPLWRMSDWAIVAAVIIIAIIAYGLWLPQHVLTELVP